MSQFNSTAALVLKKASAIASNLFPETLGLYIIINTPAFFPFVWSVVKGFIDEKTRRSVKVTT